MKIEVNYIFRENMIDPIYEQIGLQSEAHEVEIVEQGILDLTKVVGASQFYELTQVYCEGNHSFYIDLPYEDFRYIWMTL
jgi:hypothetical protein